MKKYLTLSSIVVVSILAFQPAAAAKDKSPKKKGAKAVKKTKPKVVAVLEFKNTRKSKKHQYLEESIPEAVITSIAKLKRFQLIERQTITATMSKVEKGKKAATNDKAKEVAQILKADIYIIGSFLAVKGNVQFNGRILDARNGAVLGGATQRGTTDAKLFDALDKFSASLTASLDKAVPKETVVYRDRVVYKEEDKKEEPKGKSIVGDFTLHAVFNTGVPIGTSADHLKPGIGGRLGGNFRFLSDYINPLFEAGFNLSKGKNHVIDMTFLQAGAGLTYPIEIRFKSFLAGMVLWPFATGGAHQGTINYNLDQSQKAKEYLVASVNGGLMIDLLFSKAWGLRLSARYSHLFEEESPLDIIGGELGVSFLF